MEEAKPLLKLHYEEIAWRQDKVPLDVNWSTYQTFDKLSLVLCFTGRVGGKLFAYSAYFLTENPHYQSTKWAKNDVIFVHPEHRGGAGIKLLKYAEEELVALGVSVISYHVKKCLDWGPLAERLGYEAVEMNYLKWVGE